MLAKPMQSLGLARHITFARELPAMCVQADFNRLLDSLDIWASDWKFFSDVNLKRRRYSVDLRVEVCHVGSVRH